MTYYNTGDRFFYNIKGLQNDWPTYTNRETGIELAFMSFKDGKVTFIVSDKNGKWLEEYDYKGTKSIKKLNKQIEKFGLQFTDF